MLPFAINALELPEIISNGMVLQQSTNAKLWGWGNPNSEIKITTSWNQKSYTSKANKDGKWTVDVSTPKASFTPYYIEFSDTKETIKIDDILIGEVWLCSGQSNMEMPLNGFWTQPVENSNQAIAYSGQYPGIRFATIAKTPALTPQQKVSGKWKLSNPENAPQFSAVAYFFAQSLTKVLNIPIGIISCSWGGSKVEGWIPREILNTYKDIDLNVLTNGTLKDWEKPLVMYNGMLHPLIGYTIKGFLWSQGESNVGKEKVYPQRMADMVNNFRVEWNNNSLPFYFVEIAPYSYNDECATNAALLREAQYKASTIIPKSGIVSTSDLVYTTEIEDIHASQKQPIGERLAFMALVKDYGIKGIQCESPVYESMEVLGDTAILHFKNAPDGFTPNRDLKGFEVAGADQIFYSAIATEIYESRDIKVWSRKVKDIKSVRYCFRNWALGRVHNLRGLPIIPFRTDNWDK